MAHLTVFLLAVLYLLFLVGVALRRLVSGPLRPAWSCRQETMVRFIRWLGRRSARAGIPAMKERIDRLPSPMGSLRSRVELEPVEVAGVPGQWILPRAIAEGAPVLYYLHGGGYVLCSVDTHRRLIARLALRADVRALGLDYRLGPDHRFPAAVEDAVAGYRWLLERTPASRVVLAGDSAGGGLALATLLALKRAGAPLPAGAALISAWVDLTVDEAEDDSLTENADLDYIGGPDALRRMADLYLGDADPRDPLASPVHGDLAGLPPLLIQVGGLEMLHDQNERLARRASEAGVQVEFQVWPEMVHVWHAFGHVFRPQAREAIANIAAFINQRTSSSSN
jgi:acetyl esterase/lipase